MRWVYSRLRTEKYLGLRAHPSYTLRINGDHMADVVQNAGIMVLGDDNRRVVTLTPRTEPDAKFSTVGGWKGTTRNVYQVQSAFGVVGNNAVGLIYDSKNPTTGTEATITSLRTFNQDEGIYIKWYSYATGPENGAVQHCAFQFGRWRLISYRDSFYVGRITAAWNIAEEKAQLDAGMNDPQQTEIFDVFKSVKITSGDSVMGEYHHVRILPEPNHGLHIISGATSSPDEYTFVSLPNEETGSIYPKTPITAYTRRTGMFFQIGRLTFTSSQLRTREFTTPYDNADNWNDNLLTSNITYNINANTPYATSVRMNYRLIDDEKYFFTVDLVTANSGTYAPFLQWAEASLPAGEFIGNTQFQIDTDDLLDTFDNSPVMDIVPNCDGDMRRQQYEIRLRHADKIYEKLFAFNGNPQSYMLENQVASLSMGYAHDNLRSIVTNGIITNCQAHDAAHAEHTPPPNAQRGFHPWTSMSLTLCDAWAILDEDIIRNEICGDGMPLGKYVKVLLRNAGFSEAQINVSETAGFILPEAQSGSHPCILPQDDQSRGDYLRSLFDTYGFDWQLYIDSDGVWQMRKRPTNVRFAWKTGTRDRNDTEVILSPLEWVRDTSDFYNYFRVEGAEVRGRRLVQEYTIHESIQGRMYVDNAKNYIGRIKPYPTVRNDGLRDKNHLQLVLRSLVQRHGVSCRFVTFDTYFRIGLYQWDRITIDGKPFAISSIGGGSLAENRMQIVAMEL